MERARVAVAPFASVTCTVKFDVPAVVGVPLITPVAVLRASPVGSGPTDTAQLYGVLPPAATTVWLYEEAAVPSGSAAVLTLTTPYTVIDNDLSFINPFASVTLTVMLLVPAVVGNPLTSPVDPLRLRPAGSTPTTTDQASGDLPPVDNSVWL